MKPMLFRTLLLLAGLCGLCSAQVRYIGSPSKTMTFDNLQIGVGQNFQDTLLFQDGADTLVAPYAGSFRVTAPADTVIDTVFSVRHDTVRIVQQDTVMQYATVYVDSTLHAPIENRWVVGSDTIMQVRLDSCAYLMSHGNLLRKYGCR